MFQVPAGRWSKFSRCDSCAVHAQFECGPPTTVAAHGAMEPSTVGRGRYKPYAALFKQFLGVDGQIVYCLFGALRKTLDLKQQVLSNSV